MTDLFVDFNLKSELEKLYKWKFTILGICLVSGALSALFTSPFFIQPLYKGQAAFIPPDLASLSTLDFGEFSYKGVLTGTEIDVDRTVHLITTPEIKDVMAEKFDLYHSYGLLPKGAKPELTTKNLYYDIWDDRVQVKFTEYTTIQINVLDEDPEKAARMANEIVKYADEYFELLSRRKVGLAEAKRTVSEMRARRDSFSTELTSLRTRYNIFHVDNLNDAVSQKLLKNVGPDFILNYDRLVSLEGYVLGMNAIINQLEREIFVREKNLRTYPTFTYVLSNATPNYQKVKPLRGVITITVVLSTLLVSCFVILAVTKKKNEVIPI